MWTSEYPVWWKQTPINTVLLGWCFRWHSLFLWSFASILVLNSIRTPCFWLKQAPMKMWPLFDSHISSAGLQVSPQRIASHLHLSISLKSSSNLSTLRNDLTFFGLLSKDISEYFPSFFSTVLLLVLPSSFSWSWLSSRLSYFGCVFGVCPCLWMLNGKSPRVFEQIPCPPPEVVTCWRPLIVMSSSRLPVSLFGGCSESRVSIVWRPLIHLFDYLLTCCLVLVEYEGSDEVGCGREFTLYRYVFRFSCDANSLQWDSANFVEAVFCVSQLFL